MTTFRHSCERANAFVTNQSRSLWQAVSRSILHKNSAKTSCTLFVDQDCPSLFSNPCSSLLSSAASALLKKIHYFTSGGKEATRMFVRVCVLAGCDFIDLLPNMGFAVSKQFIALFLNLLFG